MNLLSRIDPMVRLLTLAIILAVLVPVTGPARGIAQFVANAAVFLLFFLKEQRESVGQYGDLISRLDRAGDNEAAMLMIDTELGA